MPSNHVQTETRKRPGRRPLNLTRDVKVERSRQSARECRARKRLRYQYLEDLVGCKENAIYQLRKELQLLYKMCKTIDKGDKPDNLYKMSSHMQKTTKHKAVDSSDDEILQNSDSSISKNRSTTDWGKEKCLKSPKKFDISVNDSEMLFALIARSLSSESKDSLENGQEHEDRPSDFFDGSLQNDLETLDLLDDQVKICLDNPDEIELEKNETEIVDWILKNETDLETGASEEGSTISMETASSQCLHESQNQVTGPLNMTVQNYIDFLTDESDAKSLVEFDITSPQKRRRHTFSHFDRSSLRPSDNNQLLSLEQFKNDFSNLPNHVKTTLKGLCHSVSVQESNNSGDVLSSETRERSKSTDNIENQVKNTQDKFPFLSFLLTTENV